MATKEDILEQLVGEYLLHQGYFIRNNIKFLPSRNHPEFNSQKDSNHSDIDILAFHPKKQGHERVLAVSCKSWQSGFNVETKLQEISENKIISGREAWKSFRELTVPKWSQGFCNTVEEQTNCKQFTYVLAVTKVIGNPIMWEQHPPFKQALSDNPMRILTFGDMLKEVAAGLNTTLAATNIGRTLQLLKSAGFYPPSR